MELWQLKQRQSLPLEAKIILSQTRIREWYEYWRGQVYVSFSGGKDSTVLLHLVRQIYPDVPAVFVNTGLEYPEIVRFVKGFENVEVLRPKMSFRQVVTEYGYPVISKEVAQTIHEAKLGLANNRQTYVARIEKLEGTYLGRDGTLSKYNIPQWKFLLDAPFKISDECCRVMKKEPFKQYEKVTRRKPYIGVMAQESRLRRTSYLRYGCNSFEGRPKSHPLAFWLEQDVYHYIKQNNLPIAKVYGEVVSDDMFGDKLKTTGAHRTGCMFCMFGVHMDKYPNRFQRMKQTHPKLWSYCMDKLGLREVLEYINVPCE